MSANSGHLPPPPTGLTFTAYGIVAGQGSKRHVGGVTLHALQLWSTFIPSPVSIDAIDASSMSATMTRRARPGRNRTANGCGLSPVSSANCVGPGVPPAQAHNRAVARSIARSCSASIP